MTETISSQDIYLSSLPPSPSPSGSRGDSRVIKANMLPMDDMDGLSSALDHSVADGGQSGP
jgi:hypothetical protein